MSRIKLPEGADDESIQLMMMPSAMPHVMASASEAIYDKSTLDVRVREAVRMRIALINQCPICLAFRFPDLEEKGIDEFFYAAISEWHDSDLFSNKERLALEYTELMANNHLSITDEFFDQLKTEFNDEDIFELTACINFLIANGRILQVLHIQQSCPIPQK